MILIAYDGSRDARTAVERAGQLLPGEKAVVLVVWEPFAEVMAHTGAGLGLAPGIADFEEIDAASEAAANQRAAEGAELAGTVGLDAEPRVCAQIHTVWHAIVTQAREADARAIVIGTRGLTGVKSILLGSVSHGVVQHADRPVVVVPSPEAAEERADALN
ncbi:MAG TPA: universal stress protein [Solirubrobacteraceae bacterium]|jgi:nucleotide-binding universal stress UspA family protein|nr:universal stress protein [Solirubrobacteraceae bacterium]